VRVAEAQVRLFEANFSAAMNRALDRAIGRAIAGFLALIGAGCLLAAMVILLHDYLRWWASLAITGVAMIAAGLAIMKIVDLTTRR
jgi:hypothetical protein